MHAYMLAHAFTLRHVHTHTHTTPHHVQTHTAVHTHLPTYAMSLNIPHVLGHTLCRAAGTTDMAHTGA